MMTGELQADKHLGAVNVGEQRLQLRVGALESLATDQHLHRLAAQPIRSAAYQDVETLAGIDTDMDGKGAGEGSFLIGGHGAAREKGSRGSDYVLAGRVKRE